jgi:hypothetical protein
VQEANKSTAGSVYKLSKACAGTEWVLTGKLITGSFKFIFTKVPVST